MYKHTLRLSTLVGFLFWVVSVTVGLFLGLLIVDSGFEIKASDWGIVGGDLLFLVIAIFLMSGVKWIRIPLSILLHIAVVSLIVVIGLLVKTPDLIIDVILGIVMCFMGIGVAWWGILVLHSRAFKTSLGILPDPAITESSASKVKIGLRVLGWALLSLIILLIPLSLNLPFFWLEPNPTVDYLSQVNALHDHKDPNQNAAPEYEKAFETFHELPEALSFQWNTWPGDFNEVEVALLQEWMTSNETAREHFKNATEKSYWWVPYESTTSALSGIDIPDLKQRRLLSQGMHLIALYEALQGNEEEACELLKSLLKMGMQQIEQSTLVEQLVGLAITGMAGKGVFLVLDRCSISNEAMAEMQHTFESNLSRLRIPLFSETERLYGYDCIQHYFSDDGSGNGRLIPKILYEKQKDGGLYSSGITYLDALLICMSHPDRTCTTEMFEYAFPEYQILAEKTPWELHCEGTSHEEELDWLLEGNYFLSSDHVAISRIMCLGWRGRATLHALSTCLAAYRFHAETGQWPDTLKALVDAHYLQVIPNDPYSGNALVYRLSRDSFILYSVGADFEDNGGVGTGWGELLGEDQVFWPLAEEDSF